MFGCCLCSGKDGDSIIDDVHIPELDKEDIIKIAPKDGDRCDKWGDYLFELNGWNIENYKDIFIRLDSLAIRHLFVSTMGRYIYNYRNCKVRLNRLKRRERIKWETLALRRDW